MRCAADTNFLINLAATKELALDALAVVRERAPHFDRLVTETAVQELHQLLEQREDPQLAAWASEALERLETDWGFLPVRNSPADGLRVGNIAAAFIRDELLPPAEQNDARILAETAVLGCVLLISDDSHLHGINRDQLTRSLRPFGLEAPAIVTTGQIVRLFYR